MPVSTDILGNKVLGREEGERNLLRLQIESRFGATPEWAKQHLAQFSESELGDLRLLLLRAEKVEDLMRLKA